MMEEPTIWNHWALKSDMSPAVRPNEKNYSLQLVLIRSRRNAVLKNYRTKVTVVVFSSLIVSVL